MFPGASARITRRRMLQLGGMAAAAPALAAASPALGGSLLGTATAGAANATDDPGFRDPGPSFIWEITIADLQDMMADGQITSRQLVDIYTRRIDAIDRNGPVLNSIIELNPDARSIAQARDEERAHGQVRGPLHGIPIVLKDNVDTGDKMQTAAGSLALVGTPAPQDSTTAARLRAAGAVILGKTTLSEWANFRGANSSSGWSGRGGQCNNPYAIDLNPCGSSSGSGAATSANLTVVSIGTETDGSIVCPAHQNGVVGIKPTVGLTSRAGVVPISHNQDTVGPHGRTVADAATVLGALTGVDPRDPATAASQGHFFHDYRPFLDGRGLQGARLGVATDFLGISPKADAVFEANLQAIQGAGATLIDVSFPHIAEINAGAAETFVLNFDFKGDLQAYLANRVGVPITTLADAIAFNLAHAEDELLFFGQEVFLASEAVNITDPATIAAYQKALHRDHVIGGSEGIDLLLQQNHLDAIVTPTGGPAWPTDLSNGDHFGLGTSSPAAVAGYPIINVPAGMIFSSPVGISFMGTAWSEPLLIKLASGFEHVTQARQRPLFLSDEQFDTRGVPNPGGRRRVAAPGPAATSRLL
jgi:amidase